MSYEKGGGRAFPLGGKRCKKKWAKRVGLGNPFQIGGVRTGEGPRAQVISAITDELGVGETYRAQHTQGGGQDIRRLLNLQARNQEGVRHLFSC